MKKTKAALIYITLITVMILLFSSFDAQFYFDFSKTASLDGAYLYKIFTDNTASLPKTPADSNLPEEKLSSYEIGTNSSYVLEYKFILYYLGYMSYPTTKVFDEEMQTAVNDYRSQNNMTANGLLDTTLMSMLDAETLEYRQSMRGEEILFYQQILQRLGYIPAEEGLNGVFGELTYYAVNTYQKDRGLEVTGTLNNATMTDLSSDKTELDGGKTPEEVNGEHTVTPEDDSQGTDAEQNGQ